MLPARPAHPKDEAKLEVGVQIAQRWILARPAELVDDLNDRTMKTYRASRREIRFSSYDGLR